MSNQDITNPADEIRKEEKYSIPSLPLPYDLALGLLKKEKNGQGELLYQHPAHESIH